MGESGFEMMSDLGLYIAPQLFVIYVRIDLLLNEWLGVFVECD